MPRKKKRSAKRRGRDWLSDCEDSSLEEGELKSEDESSDCTPQYSPQKKSKLSEPVDGNQLNGGLYPIHIKTISSASSSLSMTGGMETMN